MDPPAPPASVVTIPERVSMTRSRPLLRSAMMREKAPSKTIPVGLLKNALLPVPSILPVIPPTPASVVTVHAGAGGGGR